MKASALLVIPVALCLAGCGDSAKFPEIAGQGPSPTIPAPTERLIPTVKIAPAKGWPKDRKPAPASGFSVTAFATGLDHPRTLLVLPGGDVLVAETNAPERPEDGRGVKGMIYKQVQSWAGAGVKSANRITLLRDRDGDGVAEHKSVFLKDLNSPFGMTLVGSDLYIANTDAVVRFPYVEGADMIEQSGHDTIEPSGRNVAIARAGQKIADLPAGPLNHHWTKGLAANRDGTVLYASVGSNSNVAENGIDQEKDRAAIHEIDLRSGRMRELATGLRNAVALATHPQSGVLWAVVNERDELGSDLVPDYLTSVKDGGFYGWPYSYWGQHVDDRVKPQNPGLVAKAIVPDYALGNHVAPLGLAFAQGPLMPERFRDGVFIGEHGSWNRNPRSGYKVVFVPFADGKPAGSPIDILTGFVDSDGKAMGRPVGVAIDKTGALLVADDVGNTVWRVAPSAPQAASR
jgi:glucose/arabinose dehydrogenase